MLRRRPVYLRFDVLIVTAVCIIMCLKFGWQITDKENLLAVGCLIIAMGLNGVLLLMNYWSVAAHEFYAYKRLRNDQIE